MLQPQAPVPARADLGQLGRLHEGGHEGRLDLADGSVGLGHGRHGGHGQVGRPDRVEHEHLGNHGRTHVGQPRFGDDAGDPDIDDEDAREKEHGDGHAHAQLVQPDHAVDEAPDEAEDRDPVRQHFIRVVPGPVCGRRPWRTRRGYETWPARVPNPRTR